MNKNKSLFLLACLIFSITGCRTLDPRAQHVMVREKSGPECKDLGQVWADWSWWGATSESINAMKNQVAEKGGNDLVQTGDASGFAYDCPDGPSAQGKRL